MIEQQFLTTFNNISSRSSQALLKDKKTNLIIDFINGTYQGYLSFALQPEGLGTALDDEFNFILCSNWQAGKIDGLTFIKLASQITIWGLWNNNAPKDFCSVKIGPYLIFIPYPEQGRMRRPKKCLVYQEGKQKMYISTIQRYPEGTKSKREYSIVIQKIIPTRERTLSQVLSTLDMRVPPQEQNMMAYLKYLWEQQNIINLSQKENGLFIAANLGQNVTRLGCNLGLLLDKKKLFTKSVGTYSNKNEEFSSQREETKFATLNGIGLSKTMESQSIIGVFKDDMLVRELNAEQNIENIRNNSKNYARNLNGSVVKQLLGHEHMKSMSYQHNYLYFPEIKRIVATAVQLHKYVEMFERLSHQEKNEEEINESMHHPTEKYNTDFVTKQQSSSASIIDQYPEFRVNLSKQLYRQVEPAEQNTQPLKRQPFQDSSSSQRKQPGFIFSRTTRNLTEIQEKSPKSPSGSPHPRLNRKLEYSKRSPIKNEPKWKI